ncbi:MAG: DUF2752 domain-containing protein [Chloroflexota bacterium]
MSNLLSQKPDNWNKNPRLKFSFFSGGSLLGLVSLYLINPAEVKIGILACPFYTLTGCYCPACGATRAVHQLLHGQVLEAMHLNILLVLLVPFLGWVWWSMARAILAGQRWPGIRFTPLRMSLILGIMVVFTVLRNLPLSPFNWFVP